VTKSKHTVGAQNILIYWKFRHGSPV